MEIRVLLKDLAINFDTDEEFYKSQKVACRFFKKIYFIGLVKVLLPDRPKKKGRAEVEITLEICGWAGYKVEAG